MCCVELEELVECVRCVCDLLGVAYEESGEWMRVLDLGCTNSVETGGVSYVCL